MRHLRVLLLLLIGGCFVFALWHYWESQVFAKLRFDEVLLYLSIAGSLGLTLCLGILWLFILQRLAGKPLPLAAGLYVHLIAWLGRYTPGKLGLFLGKALLGQKLASGGREAAASVIYENALFIASGVVIAAATVSLPGVNNAGQYGWLVQALVVLAIFACLLLAPRSLFWFLNRFREWFPRRLQNVSWQATLRDSDVALLSILYCVPHVCAGLGFFALIYLVVPDSGIGWLAAIGILTAAHLAGIFAAFAPAGLGVREAALGALLLPHMPAESAVSLALLARLTSILADVVVFAVVAACTPYAKRHANLF